MKAADKRRLKKQLVDEHSELLQTFKRSQEVQMHPAEEGLMDLGDGAAESYAKEFLYRLNDADRARLHQVDEALKRMGEGQYGECEQCGETIPGRRLNAIPWALLCIEWQEKIEAGARG